MPGIIHTGGSLQESAVMIAMSDEDYFGDKRLGRSDVFTYHKSPALYKAKLDGKIPSASTPAMAFGSAFHAMVLEPECFAERYTVASTASKTSSKYKAEVKEAAENGMSIISPSDMEMMRAMSESCMQNKFFREKLMHPESRKEDVILFDLMGAFPAKAKVDLMAPGVIVDLKTSASADPEDFRSSLTKYGYHWQSYWYKQAAAAVGMPCEFYFAVISKQAPYEFSIITLGHEYEEIAESEIAAALEGIAMERYDSRWKDEIFTLDPKPWEKRKRQYFTMPESKPPSFCAWCGDPYYNKGLHECGSCGSCMCSQDCLELHDCG